MKISRVFLAIKAFRELGPLKLGLFALYKLGLKSGYFRGSGEWGVDSGNWVVGSGQLLDLPDPDIILEIIGPDALLDLKAEADEIVDGSVRLFGGEPVPLNLTPPGELTHWTDYALGKSPFPDHPNPQLPNYPITDIKFIWEPARFGWVFTLGRAYHLTEDERYPEAFWRYFEIFQQANPVNQGPNWESAQEAALRLIAFAFAAQVFAGSMHSSENRKSEITTAIAEHANRIPPTLIYARAQNNNHLLSEAAGLITASLALPEHPRAKRWSKLGWKWFKRGLQSQIAEDGAYMQQSSNYHRLALQLALWVFRMGNGEWADLGDLISKLQLATRWLLGLTDPDSGRVPNLGPNDGAYILPLTVGPFYDYRAVLQAASRAFLGTPSFELGPWDEMSLWLAGEQLSRSTDHRLPITAHRSPTPSTLSTPHSWAYLHAARFDDRPGHADQLHLDLWWRGLNVAQDAGTYLYNADPPWDNALTHTAVHNTVMIDNRQQMTPAGRFLYLDRAQAEVLKRQRADDGSWEQLTAWHNGYRRFGMMHIRSVTADKDDRWLIEDHIQPLADDAGDASHSVRLHWLLPDWTFELQNKECGMRIKSPYGWVELAVSSQQSVVSDPLSVISVQLVRAGELLHGNGDISPAWGWVSPTYAAKQPALSFSVTAVGELPLTFRSEWRFPNG